MTLVCSLILLQHFVLLSGQIRWRYYEKQAHRWFLLFSFFLEFLMSRHRDCTSKTLPQRMGHIPQSLASISSIARCFTHPDIFYRPHPSPSGHSAHLQRSSTQCIRQQSYQQYYGHSQTRGRDYCKVCFDFRSHLFCLHRFPISSPKDKYNGTFGITALFDHL